VQEGATVAIKTIVARIGDGAAKAAAPPPAQKAAVPPPPPPPPTQVPAAPLPPPVRSFPPPPPPPVPKPAAAGPYPIEPPPQQQEAPPPAAAPPPAEGEEEYGLLSPLVRKMAREFNVDLSQVRGTGAGGRITKQDVETYMATSAYRSHQGSPAATPPCCSPRPSARRGRPPICATTSRACQAPGRGCPASRASPASSRAAQNPC
jgi:2-oxoglutarate dehydrogenase E2 component (dihydrolipoamide succinyltransferase)